MGSWAVVVRRSIIVRVCWRVEFAVWRAGVRTGEVIMSSMAMVVMDWDGSCRCDSGVWRW